MFATVIPVFAVLEISTYTRNYWFPLGEEVGKEGTGTEQSVAAEISGQQDTS